MNEDKQKTCNLEETVMQEKIEIDPIKDDSHANWYIQKLKEKKEEMNKFINFYEGKIDQIKNDYQRFEEYVYAILQQYLSSDNIIPKITKTEIKYDLPDGIIKLKKQPLKYIRDDELLLKAISDAGLKQYILTKYSVDWANLKKAITTDSNGDVILDGEVLAGVHAEEQPDKFTIS